MKEEWKFKGELLQEVDVLRNRLTQLEQVEHLKVDGKSKEPGQIIKAVFDGVAEGMLLADVEKKQFLTGNKAICQMLGYDQEEIANLRIMNIYPPEDLHHGVKQFEKQASGELMFAKDIPVKRKDGNIFYADIISIPLKFSGKSYLMSFLRETSPLETKSLQQDTSAGIYEHQLLTTTEIKILKSVVNGMSNKEIASLFHRSTRTIENHRAHLMKKLGVDNSVELVKRAVAMGLVDLQEEQRDEDYETSFE